MAITGLVPPEPRVTQAPYRILFFYPRQQMDTGSPHALVAVVDSLDRDEFAPAFLSGSDGPLTTKLRAHDVHIVPGFANSVSPRHPVAGIAGIRRQMRLLASERIDVIHLHEEGWNYDLLIAAAILGIPVVMHVHNPVVAERRNVDWAIASRVIFVSHAHRASAGRLDRIAAKAEVIYNSIDIDRCASGTPIRDALGVGPDDVVVGTVAQISHRKGIDVLIDVAATLLPRNPRLLFLVAGPPALGQPEFADEMRRRAADPALEGRVRFIGSRGDVPDFLASCDVFFLPTRAEPMGMAVVEAMAARLPVVASHVGGIPEIIASPDIGRLVQPMTVDAFAAAIEDLVSRADRGRSIGEAALRSVRARFDRPVIASQWRALYRELAERRRASRR